MKDLLPQNREELRNDIKWLIRNVLIITLFYFMWRWYDIG